MIISKKCRFNNKQKQIATDLPNISLSSCSDTNCPRFATKSVEQGGLLTPIPGWDEDEPTGEASAGLGKKCGREAACTEVSAVGWGIDIGGCEKHLKSNNANLYLK